MNYITRLEDICLRIRPKAEFDISIVRRKAGRYLIFITGLMRLDNERSGVLGRGACMEEALENAYDELIRREFKEERDE